MKRAGLLLIVFFAAFIMTGCVYTHVTMPYSTDLNKTELGQKQGTASFYSVLWLFAWGDAGAAAAAQNGGISVLTHMDREFYSILFGIYTRTSTVVYGD